jgi:hypothetical protein
VSVRAIAAVFECSNLPPVPRLVLLALADHADHDGYAWPAIDRLAQKTGLHRRTVKRSLDEAVLAGELRRTTTGGGRHVTTVYQVLLAVDISPDFSTKGGTAPLFQDAKGWRSVPKRVALSTKKRPHKELTIIEPRGGSTATEFPPVDPAVPEKVAEIRAALQRSIADEEAPA